MPTHIQHTPQLNPQPINVNPHAPCTLTHRPLVVTSADRLDIVLGLLAAQLSVHGPGVAGVLLTQAGSQRAGRNYARWVPVSGCRRNLKAV